MTSETEVLRGKALTVLGPVPPEELGVTLPHEHLFLDFRSALTKPTYGPDLPQDIQFSLPNLGDIHLYPYSAKDNLLVDDEADMLKELDLFKQAGGGCLCELTVTGIRIKSSSLLKLSKETGVNVIHGTGFYVDPVIPEEARSLTVEELAEIMVKEIQEGIPGTGVRCGVIGEIGCSWPLTDMEKRVLKASALAQTRTGAPLIIHPGRNPKAPFEILDVLEQAGADISRTAMSHLDRTISDVDELLKLAQRGCYLEFDLFGIEVSNYQLANEIDMPSDAQRIQRIKALVDGGFSHRILLSHDIHTKHRLVMYGGHGFAYLLNYVVHKMVDRGIPKDVVTKMTTTNPQTWLTFA